MTSKKNGFEDSKAQVFTQAAQIFSSIWMPRLFDELATGNSPPEELLALVLEVLLWEELRSGRVELKKQERVTGPGITKNYYQPDFVVHQKKTDAKVIIECDGYNFHRATSEQFTMELKRERELQKCGYRLYRFSAEELFTNPWDAGLDVLDIINCESWGEFEEIVLPKGLLTLSDKLKSNYVEKSEANSAEVITSPTETDLSELALRVNKLPIRKSEENMPEKLVSARQKFARAYEPWSSDEDEWLILAFEQSQDLSEIADIFLRQKSSIRARLKKMKIDVKK